MQRPTNGSAQLMQIVKRVWSCFRPCAHLCAHIVLQINLKEWQALSLSHQLRSLTTAILALEFACKLCQTA